MQVQFAQSVEALCHVVCVHEEAGLHIDCD